MYSLDEVIRHPYVKFLRFSCRKNRKGLTFLVSCEITSRMFGFNSDKSARYWHESVRSHRLTADDPYVLLELVMGIVRATENYYPNLDPMLDITQEEMLEWGQLVLDRNFGEAGSLEDLLGRAMARKQGQYANASS